MKPKVDTKALGEAKILDSKKNSIALKTFWAEKPALLVFVRHFGCTTCRVQVAELWDVHRDLEDRTMNLVIIGNGSPDYIDQFKIDLKIKDFPIYTDPSLKSFDLAGLKRSIGSVINPSSAINVVRDAIKHPSKIGIRLQGNLWQQGGTLLINKNEKLVFQHINKAVGDHPDLDRIPVVQI